VKFRVERDVLAMPSPGRLALSPCVSAPVLAGLLIRADPSRVPMGLRSPPSL